MGILVYYAVQIHPHNNSIKKCCKSILHEIPQREKFIYIPSDWCYFYGIMKTRLLLLMVALLCSAVPGQQKNAPVVVTVKLANVRETPSARSKIVGRVKKGELLVASANEGDWYYISHGRTRGWLHYTVIKKAADSDLPDLSRFEVKDPARPQSPLPPIQPPSKEWTLVSATTANDAIETIFYFRPDSLIKLYAGTYKVWARAVEVKPDVRRGYYSLQLFVINCPSNQYKITRIVIYDAKDNILSDEEVGDMAFVDAIPSSIAHHLLQKACALM